MFGRGYLNQPELTECDLLLTPKRLYRTGDLARWFPDGNIKYIGRKDNQVKIRGNRIEIGKVESQILQIRSIKEAIVTVYPDAQNEQTLCAYYVVNEELSNRELGDNLSMYLPNYMIPTYFVHLNKIPLTPNGKFDIKLLSASKKIMQTDVEYVSPDTFIQKTFARVWVKVLDVKWVGIHYHFLESGYKV
ncbi:AMP-binding protein [Bacillus cereus]|nr:MULTISPECIES: AMP-binding protein [Bacillus]MCU5490669.1 AMP-binding protein [Bacillus cereus]